MDNPNDIENLVKALELSFSEGTAIPYMEEEEVLSVLDYYIGQDNLEHLTRIMDIGLEQHPGSSTILLYKANYLANDNKLSEAQSILDYLLPLEPSNPYVYIGYGWLNIMKNDEMAAFSFFDKAISLGEGVNLYFEIGQSLNQNGYPDMALRYLEDYKSKIWEDEFVFLELGFAYEALGRIEKSIKMYEQSLKIYPYFERAWYHLGNLYNKKNKSAKALNAYKTAICVSPDFPDPYYDLAKFYVKIGKYRLALDSFLDYASFQTDFSSTLLQHIGYCLEQLGENDLAIRYLQAAINKDPDNADSYYVFSAFLISIGRAAEGIEAIEKAIKINPEDADYYFSMAHGYIVLEDYEKAEKSLKKGIKKNPNEVLAWIELFKIKANHNQFNIKLFMIDNKARYGFNNVALKYLEAYIEFYYYDNVFAARQCLKSAVLIDSSHLEDLLEEAQEMLMHPDINPIIKKYIKI